MDIKLFNSLTNQLETFKSIKEKKVSMYVCGSTVYDSPHIGNLRPIVVFDVLRRLFIYLGYEVVYASNFTDVDDKIINRAQQEHIAEMEIANRYIKEVKQMIAEINAQEPTYSPRVSDYIPKIIDYIKKLVETKHAYVLDGDVYFRVNSVENYGELSKINPNDLKVGARVEEDNKKGNRVACYLGTNPDKMPEYKKEQEYPVDLYEFFAPVENNLFIDGIALYFESKASISAS